jgi:hypothetical protein
VRLNPRFTSFANQLVIHTKDSSATLSGWLATGSLWLPEVYMGLFLALGCSQTRTRSESLGDLV